MRKILVISLVAIFLALLFRNAATIKKIIETSSKLFRETFKTVTDPAEFQ